MIQSGTPRLNYFKLLDQPFDNTRDTRFFFESDGHGEALSRLQFLAQDRNMGMGVLTGDIGCGKTMTRTMLHNSLSPNSYKVVSIENCMLDFDGLLLEVISQLQGERVYSNDYPDRYSKLAAFKRLLVEVVCDTGRHLVVLLDEAQQLTDEAMDGAKGLTNIASEKANFVSVVLFGQPELKARVSKLPQIDQRVSLRYHLNPLTPAETVRYLIYRMQVAGLHGPSPFTKEAVQMIFQSSQGVPREINRICKLALDHAIANQGTRLDSSIVGLVVRDLYRQRGQLKYNEFSV